MTHTYDSWGLINILSKLRFISYDSYDRGPERSSTVYELYIRTCTYISVQVIVQMTKLYVQVATFQAAFVSSSAAMKS